MTDFVYELPHKFSNSRLRIVENWEILEKSQTWMGAQPSVQPPLNK